MAFNREKALASAAKFAARGQHDRAAREYQSIVEADPSDIRSWVMLADCLVRAGDDKGAIERYLKIADFYAQQDEPTKAIAVYRQILGFDNNRLDVHLKIAALLRQLDRIPDAVATYEFVAQAYFQAGQVAEGLEGFRMVAELDPGAVAKRLRLAELYSREGRKNEAVEHFRLAAQRLLGDRRFEDFIRVAERLLYHKEDDVQILRDLAEIYLHQKEHRRALVKLNALLRLAPSDPGGLELLAETFVALGKQDKAVSVALELAREQRKHDLEGKERAARVLKKALGWNPEKPAEIKKMLVELEAELVELRKGEPDIEVAEVVEEDMDLDLDVDIEEDEDEDAIGAEDEDAGEGEEVGEDGYDANLSEADKRLIEARVYVRYRMFEHALVHVTELLTREPQNRGALDVRASALAGLGKVKEAADVHVRLAQFIGDSDPELAQRHLNLALGLVPNHPTAAMVLAALEALGRSSTEASPPPRKAEASPPRKVEGTPSPAPSARRTEGTPSPAPLPRKAEATPSPSPLPRKPEATPTPSPLPRKPEATPTPSPLPRKPDLTPPPQRVDEPSGERPTSTDDSGLLRFNAPKRRPPLPPTRPGGTGGARGEPRGRSRGSSGGEPGGSDSEGESGSPAPVTSEPSPERDAPTTRPAPPSGFARGASRPSPAAPPKPPPPPPPPPDEFDDDEDDATEAEAEDDVGPAKPPPPRLSFLGGGDGRTPPPRGLPTAAKRRPPPRGAGPAVPGLGRMPTRARTGEPPPERLEPAEATEARENVVDPTTSPALGEVDAGEPPSTVTEAPRPVEAASGEAASGEAASGEAASGEAASGEAAGVEAAGGEAAGGEAASGAEPSSEATPASELADTSETVSAAAVESAASEPTSEPTSAPAWPEIGDEIAELRFFIEQGFEEDAHATYLELERRYPAHPALAEFAGRFAAVEAPADAPVVLDEEATSDLAALASPSAAHTLSFEGEDEDDDDDFLSAIFDEPAAVQRPKAKQAPRARAEIGGGADPRTLFDLGTAYREMGLIDDALGQFAAASADPQWRARALVMMASLHLHRGAIPKAIEDLQEAVRSAVTDDEASEARYELGVIYQVMGETAKAIVELDAVKPGYRDRDARLAGLRRG